VQGLTTDITIFFVPDNSIIRTLEPHLFNVATSRAKEHTIIIADKYVFDYPTLDREVRVYLERLRNDRSLYIPNPSMGVKADANATAFLQNWGKYSLPK
jgi:ATP-dependent exoDNAse (exonuclease V) alpha subunit